MRNRLTRFGISDRLSGLSFIVEGLRKHQRPGSLHHKQLNGGESVNPAAKSRTNPEFSDFHWNGKRGSRLVDLDFPRPNCEALQAGPMTVRPVHIPLQKTISSGAYRHRVSNFQRIFVFKAGIFSAASILIGFQNRGLKNLVIRFEWLFEHFGCAVTLLQVKSIAYILSTIHKVKRFKIQYFKIVIRRNTFAA